MIRVHTLSWNDCLRREVPKIPMAPRKWPKAWTDGKTIFYCVGLGKILRVEKPETTLSRAKKSANIDDCLEECSVASDGDIGG